MPLKETRSRSSETKTNSKRNKETHILFRIIAILFGLILIASGISFYIERITTRSGIEMIFHMGTSFLLFGVLSLIGGIRGRIGIEKNATPSKGMSGKRNR